MLIMLVLGSGCYRRGVFTLILGTRAVVSVVMDSSGTDALYSGAEQLHSTPLLVYLEADAGDFGSQPLAFKVTFLC